MKSIKIGNRIVGAGKPCFIIAEAGSNHNGDLKTARRLISVAASMGADAIKFQLFTAEGLSNDKEIQKILEQFAFKRKWLPGLKKYADSKGIIFLATPFDEEAVELLENIKVDAYKIASGDLTHLQLISYIAKKNKPLLLSVGMATDNEIKEAVEVIKATGNNKIVLLHCIADYPTQPKDVNLSRISALRSAFGLPVGFSDHTLGTHIAVSSACLDSVVIEKHYTLNKRQKGPDHSFAIEPHELQSMVQQVRDVEAARGDGKRRRLKCEELGLLLGRRSLFAQRDILKGSVIAEGDLKIVRPSTGISPKSYNSVIGKKARKMIKSGEPITWKKIN